MAFDWQEYLSLARFLQDGTTSYTPEAARRSAASRAYYAAFCHARNYAQSVLGYQVAHHGQDHERVRDHLRRREKVDEADTLEALRRLRNQCDYDNVVANLSFIAMVATSLAEEMLRRLR